MMIFRSVKQSIISILAAAEAGRYETVQAQRQTTGANEAERKIVRVFYRQGDFPVSQSSPYGRPVNHRISFDIELSVAVKAGVDLSVINDPNSTSAARAAAMFSFDSACLRADNAIDELFDNIFQVIMDPDNYDLAFTKFGIADRWIENYRKDDAIERGEYAILTGVFQIVCTAEETINSEVGVSADIQDATININEDQQNQAGVSGSLGG